MSLPLKKDTPPLQVDGDGARRQELRRRLFYMTELLKHLRQVRKGLGIATEAGTYAGCSYDFVYIEGEPTENEESALAARELFGESSRRLSADSHSEFH